MGVQHEFPLTFLLKPFSILRETCALSPINTAKLSTVPHIQLGGGALPGVRKQAAEGAGVRKEAEEGPVSSQQHWD